nr:probable ribose-5-phosphate isomerase 4, chloroplastic [Tanacetum cinerariifolium]
KYNCSNWASYTSGRGVSIGGEENIRCDKEYGFNGHRKNYKSTVKDSVPVLIKSVSWMDTAEEIDDLFVGDTEERLQVRR